MPARKHNELREITVIPHFQLHPHGSVLISCGDTRVICAATIDEKVPPWMNGKNRGWVTAEYDMLPSATSTRNQRDARKGKMSGRSQEISRLIGRALRAVIKLNALGERTIIVDCDVIQADGGTRTTSITGAYIALALALRQKLGTHAAGKIIQDHVVAISTGIVGGDHYLDLDYALDSQADVDMNIVMTGQGQLVEVQGTGENATFSQADLMKMLELAGQALPKLVALQQRAIEVPFSDQPEAFRA